MRRGLSALQQLSIAENETIALDILSPYKRSQKKPVPKSLVVVFSRDAYAQSFVLVL